MLGLGGQPVDGPPLDVDDDEGQLHHEGEGDGLALQRDAGPGEPVTARLPAKAAPMALPTPAISSSAWKVRTRSSWRASSWRMSDAGVIG